MFEIGNSLRDARLRQGFDLADVEAQTKIRSKYLKALEEEQFEVLPGDTYIRGFLRTYAERLGLDGQLYVDEYNSRYADAEEPVVASRPRGRSRSTRAESHAVLVALVGIVGVTVLVIAAWRFGSTQEEDPGATLSVPPPASAATDPATTPAVPAPDPVELLVTAARGPSRVEVHAGSAVGELVWEGTLKRGESQQFAGTELWLEIARPRNLEFELNGAAVEDIVRRGPIVVVARASGLEPVPAP